MEALFIHIPKTAGTSIREWYNSNINNNNTNTNKVTCYGHVPYSTSVEKSNITFDWSFSVVRNTYERLASLYLYSWNKSKRRMEKASRRGEIDTTNTTIVREAEKGIENFFKVFIEEGRTELAGGLWMSQLTYSSGVDYILRHENLQEDFKIVQDKLECHNPLTQNRNFMNSDSKKIQNYSESYFKLIELYFQEELDYFKFKRPC
jgi:hypothetical protein